MNHKSNKINKFLLEQESALNNSLEEKWWPFKKREAAAEESEEEKSEYSQAGLLTKGKARQNSGKVKKHLSTAIVSMMHGLMVKLIEQGVVTKIIRPPDGQEEHLGTYLIRRMDLQNHAPPWLELKKPEDYARLQPYFKKWAASYLGRNYKKDFYLEIASAPGPIYVNRGRELNPALQNAQEAVLKGIERLFDKALAQMLRDNGDEAGANLMALSSNTKTTLAGLDDANTSLSDVLTHWAGILTREEQKDLAEYLVNRRSEGEEEEDEPRDGDDGGSDTPILDSLEEAESGEEPNKGRVEQFLKYALPIADAGVNADDLEKFVAWKENELPRIMQELGEEASDSDAEGSDEEKLKKWTEQFISAFEQLGTSKSYEDAGELTKAMDNALASGLPEGKQALKIVANKFAVDAEEGRLNDQQMDVWAELKTFADNPDEEPTEKGGGAIGIEALLATNSLEEFGKIYAQMIKSDPREHPPWDDLVHLASAHAQTGSLHLLGSGVPSDPTRAIVRFGDPEGRSRSKFIELVKAEFTGDDVGDDDKAQKIIDAFINLGPSDDGALEDALYELEAEDTEDSIDTLEKVKAGIRAKIEDVNSLNDTQRELFNAYILRENRLMKLAGLIK